MPRLLPLLGCLLAVASPALSREPAMPSIQWPQFRGLNASGIAPDQKPLPVEFGPGKNVVWKTVDLSSGDSSPCIWGNRIFLTGYDKEKKRLETLCIDRATGKICWVRQARKVDKIERFHRFSSPVTPTPATDGERVYVYFGSFGILCYDFDGKLLWQHRLPLATTRFGTAASPVVVGELVVVSYENLPRPYVVAVNRKTGKTVWKQERIVTGEGYATPVVWEHDGTRELMLHTSGKLMSMDLKDGATRWWVNVNSTACSTPVVGDGHVYVSTWIHGGEADQRIPVPAFASVLKRADKNKDGKLSREEFPRDIVILKRKQYEGLSGVNVMLHFYIGLIDTDKDGLVDAKEWANIDVEGSKAMEHGLLAVRPNGKGDVTESHVAWKQVRSIPEVASPLYYKGLVYLVREGGVVSCLDAKTGRLYYRERLGVPGAYFSSPVAGDGKIYGASYSGVVSVFQAGKQFKMLAQNDLQEKIMSTPAIVDGRVYVRTEKYLYAFGK